MSIVCVIVAAVCLGFFHVIYAVIFNGLIDRTRSSAFLIDFLPTAFGSTSAIVGIGLLYSVAIEQARVAKSGLLRTGLLVFAVAFGVLEVVLAVVGGITELAIISLVQQALILVAALVLIACASVASCKTGAGTPTTALVRQTRRSAPPSCPAFPHARSRSSPARVAEAIGRSTSLTSFQCFCALAELTASPAQTSSRTRHEQKF